jgi:purine-binding chemotaxis protein CheW
MSSTTVLETEKVLSRGGKYLTLSLDPEQYGIEIIRVREIIGYTECTALPHTPRFVRGVINLRGQVISVIDLRERFGMQPVPRTEQTCIVVVESFVDGRRVSTGVIVDRVLEVLNIPEQQIEAPPDFGQALATEYIHGMAKCAEGVKILLNIQAVLCHRADTTNTRSIN